MLKYLFASLCLIVLFVACRKSGTSSDPYVSYKVNGAEVQVSGDRDTTTKDPYTGFYVGSYVARPFQAAYYVFLGADASDGIMLNVQTTGQLAQTTYTTASITASLRYNGVVYGINNGDQVSVTITRISNTVEGNFSGTFSTSSGTKINVTDGKLSNLHVYN